MMTFIKQHVTYFPAPRPPINRKSVVTLALGVAVGFSLALVIVSTPSKLIWEPEYRGHRDISDPHSSQDLADAAGPEIEIG